MNELERQIEAICLLDDALNAIAKTGAQITVTTTPKLISACVRTRKETT